MKYGCHNSKRKAGYHVVVRHYHPNGCYSFKDSYIHDVMSKECRYDSHEADPCCAGCNKPQGRPAHAKDREMHLYIPKGEEGMSPGMSHAEINQGEGSIHQTRKGDQ